MTLIERLMCFVGKHNYHIDAQEKRFDLGKDSPVACVVFFGLAASFLVFVTCLLLSTTSPSALKFSGAGFVAFLFFLGLIVYLTKVEYRMDAWCLRCNKQRLELTKHKEAKTMAKEFFKNLKEIQ